MRIERLKVKNFKGFEYCSFEFDPEFNLLVGENGAGKTSALDALAVAAGSWFLGLRGYDTRHIWSMDIRLAARDYGGEIRFEEQFPVEVRAEGIVGGREISWARCLNVPGGRTTFGEAAAIKGLATDADLSVRAGHDVTLPLISYYGTGRPLAGVSGTMDRSSTHRPASRWRNTSGGRRSWRLHNSPRRR